MIMMNNISYSLKYYKNNGVLLIVRNYSTRPISENVDEEIPILHTKSH